MTRIVGFISGSLFGAGLLLSGMLDPTKVIGFLDLGGLWDPSLAFVMGGGVIVNAIGHFFLHRRSKPLIAKAFMLPEKKDLDLPLCIGAAIFGIGWGIAGLCPGPAVASLLLNHFYSMQFVLFLLAGLQLGNMIKKFK